VLLRKEFIMKNLLIVAVLVAFGVCLVGCHEEVAQEKHETITTEVIISHEIIVE
jgi:hypothetical protein